jgi:hypothetical protein
VEVSKVK